MKLLLVIKADENDADYVTKETWLRDSTLIPLIGKVAAVVLKSDQEHNWNTGHSEGLRPNQLYESKLSLEEIQLFNSYVPGGEYGVHTIRSIEIHEIVNTTRLL